MADTTEMRTFLEGLDIDSAVATQYAIALAQQQFGYTKPRHLKTITDDILREAGVSIARHRGDILAAVRGDGLQSLLQVSIPLTVKEMECLSFFQTHNEFVKTSIHALEQTMTTLNNHEKQCIKDVQHHYQAALQQLTTSRDDALAEISKKAGEMRSLLQDRLNVAEEVDRTSRKAEKQCEEQWRNTTEFSKVKTRELVILSATKTIFQETGVPIVESNSEPFLKVVVSTSQPTFKVLANTPAFTSRPSQPPVPTPVVPPTPTPTVVLPGLQVFLDAANPASYPGSGQMWMDLSGQNNHFFLGTSAEPNLGNPTFSKKSFEFVEGSCFMKAGPNGVFINSIHKPNSSFTLELWHKPVKYSFVYGFGGTSNTLNTTGFRWFLQNSLDVCNNGSTPLRVGHGNACVYGKWQMTAISIDGANATGLVYSNGKQVSIVSASFSGSSGLSTQDASNPLLLGALPDDGEYYPLVGRGTRFAIVRMYNRALSRQELDMNFAANRSVLENE